MHAHKIRHILAFAFCSGLSEMGDEESLAQLGTVDPCGGLEPTAIYCQTVEGQSWWEANQTLAVPCLLPNGLLCQNADNTMPCYDYKVQLDYFVQLRHSTTHWLTGEVLL